jgi:hypothetical protein
VALRLVANGTHPGLNAPADTSDASKAYPRHARAYAIRGIASAFAGLTATVLGLGKAFETVFLLAAGKIEDFEANARKMAADFESIGSQLRDSLQHIWQPEITVNKGPDGAKQNAGAMNGQPDSGMAAVKDLESQIKVMQQGLAQKKLIFDAEASQYKITQDEKFAALQDETQKAYDAEMGLLEKEKAIGKPRMGTGYRVRTLHEPILVATMGNPQHKPLPSLFDGVAREHSRKPDEFYDIALRHTPAALRRVDLFSRETRPGFEGWGAEHGKFDAVA